MANRKALIVINPISGGKKKSNLPDLIRASLTGKIDFKIIFWQSADQDIDNIVKAEIAESGFNMLVAAGGDGTINKMASCINGTNVCLGIIPLGSGNGLARFLKIPMNTQKAIELIGTGRAVFIDTGKINDKSFYCTSGVGFDAHIGNLFASARKRGFLTYIKIIIIEIKKFKPEEYDLFVDGIKISTSAFLIAFANSNQYGNEAQIAPEANIQDGMLNVTILKPFSIFNALSLASRLYRKNLHQSRFVETYSGKNIRLVRKKDGPVHFDGDPGIMGEEIEINICPASLKVCVSENSMLK